MPRMLIIEDEELLRNLYSELLEMKGFHVETAIDGKAALEQLNEIRKPDLILLDISLPLKDGYQVLSEIRESEELKDIPVLVVTASAMPDDREKIFNSGADDYLSKPVSPELLVDQIEMRLSGGIP